MLKIKSIRILFLCILGCLIGLNFSFAQVNVRSSPTIVIVHGAWGGGWAFKNVESLLRHEGYNVYRPTLTGQGERVHLASTAVGLKTHITDIVNVILYEDLRDIIMVGHSYGGMVITGVADSVPERIKELIYVDAFIPKDGESVLSVQGNRNDWLMKSAQDGFIIPAWTRADQTPPKDVPHSLKTYTDKIELKNPARLKIPARYILTLDKGKKPEEDDFAFFAKRASEMGWQVSTMESDHNPQWSAPENLVKMLLMNR